MTCMYNILILTPKGLTPDQAAGNQHRAFALKVSLLLSVFLFP